MYFYGVTRQTQALEMARDVCQRLTPKNACEAYALLAGTMCAETGLTTTRDTYEAQGRGVVQFDEIRFNDVRKYIAVTRPELRATIKELYGIDFAGIGFGLVLDCSPLVCLIACRVGYMMIPEKLPPKDAILHQAKYWKKHWNSSAGAGTPEHYIKAVQKHANSISSR